MIDFLEVLKEKREVVWREIKIYLNSLTVFPDYCQIPKRYSSLLNFYQKISSDYPKRKGKYVRPSLVLLIAQAMGFSEKKAIKTAAAMQVSEDWILIHDDLEDDSFQRRGGLTLHRIYGRSLAINAGDTLQILMWKILQDNEKIIGPRKTFQIMDEFYQMLNRTALGQMIEIKWTEENRTNLVDRDILLILESKTGYYTIAGPMRLGAILAGATEKQLEKIYHFGKLLGFGFQIQDDLLDLTSNFSGLKKQGDDIYEGKRTIILLHLLRNIKGKEKKELLKILKKTREEKTEKEVKWVIKMMARHGSLDHGKKLLKKFLNQASEFFDQELNFLTKQPARNQIKALIKFLEERKY